MLLQQQANYELLCNEWAHHKRQLLCVCMCVCGGACKLYNVCPVTKKSLNENIVVRPPK